VIDLRTRFDLPTQEVSKDTRFVVVKVNEFMASMVVDRVHGVETISLGLIEKPSGLVMDIDNRYLTSMARYNGQIILILDLLHTINPGKVEQR
jgi:purine-binding chemotaxis protein CheW